MDIDDFLYKYLPGPIYRIPFRIKDMCYEVKYFFQKVFRSRHTSDKELFNLYVYLAKFILPKLKAFKESPRMGYPGHFVEYNEHEWESKEEYGKALEEGKLEGGGHERWEEILDEMIYAFEYILSEQTEEKEKAFFEKYGYDWHKEIPENRIIHKCYENPETEEIMMIGEEDTPPDAPWVKTNKGIFNDRPFYYDLKQHMRASDRARKGLEYFGKYFMGLWD